MRQGELETHLNQGVKEEATAAMVAVNSPPLQASSADLVDVKGLPGLQPHCEAQEVAASTSAASLEPKRARQWTRQSNHANQQNSVKPSSMTCSNSRTIMEININYKDTIFYTNT
jgi:hypothetical protein